MLKNKLDTMVRVDLRDVWDGEAGDFTPWLAQDDNIRLLGEAVGLSLEVEAQEVDVGPFRADILCNDADTGATVIIENQLEDTDHNHLGQILTYAAGLHASAVIWVARKFRDEHRAALDWLNDKFSKSRDNPGFYAIEIELWRVGASNPAPKFNVVSKPNEFVGEVEEAGLSDSRKTRLDYWQTLIGYSKASESSLKCLKPGPHKYQGFRSPTPGYHFGFSVSSLSEKWIGIYIGVGRNEERVEILKRLHDQFGDAFSKELGETIDRTKDDEAKFWLSAGIDADPTDRQDWPRQHEWMLRVAAKLVEIFPKYEAMASEASDNLQANA